MQGIVVSLYIYIYISRDIYILNQGQEIHLFCKYCYTVYQYVSTNRDSCPNDTHVIKCCDEDVTTKSWREISEIQSTKNIIFIIFLLFAF